MAKQSQVGDQKYLDREIQDRMSHPSKEKTEHEVHLPNHPEGQHERGEEGKQPGAEEVEAEDRNDDEFELKEMVDRERFIAMMNRVAKAMSNNQPIELEVEGQTCKVPADAVSRGKLEVEYEYEDGEYELEFTMKWRD